MDFSELIADLLHETKELNHTQYFSAVERMYAEQDLAAVQDFTSYSQRERFRRELAALQQAGLRKRLKIELNRSRGDFTARKFSDGKVDQIYSASDATIRESYFNQKGGRVYRRKIKYAFVSSSAVKSNQTLRYDADHLPHCLNCGAQLTAQGDKFHCTYCGSWYEAEAYKYLLTRFYMESAFKGFRYAWLVLVPIFIVAILPAAGLLDRQQGEALVNGFSVAASLVLTLLFFGALAVSLARLFKDRRYLRSIRRHDPYFSQEIFRNRVTDLLAMHPELLLSGARAGKPGQGVICRSVQEQRISNYERQGAWEFVELEGKADALFLDGSGHRVRLRHRMAKFHLRLGRIYGTLTPVHYSPDQFTCQNCGSHEIIEHAGTQVCSYCHTERREETIDWVLA